MTRPVRLGIGQLATLASILEAAIPKPGNVHRSADFGDTAFSDFLISAVAIGPAMDAAARQPLGRTVLDAVRATRALVPVNTNLGMVLLMAPLAAADAPDPAAVRRVIDESGPDDCRMIHEAIALCRPGGLGSAEQYDVTRDAAPDHIRISMQLAADRDLIAAQYVNGFEQVFASIEPGIAGRAAAGMPLADAVIQVHLETMRDWPDSLIRRKAGETVAREAAARAGAVVDAGETGSPQWLAALEDFDFWLRSDGNRRNPGTTADLIAAGLFAGFRRGTIPFR